MKLITKIATLGAGLVVSAAAFAADPIVGNWQMSENGQPKAVVKISEAGGKFNGVVVTGQTEKAKQYVGKTVLQNVEAVGGGKYKGKAKDPRWGVLPAVNADITLNGNKLTLKTLKGSQVLTRK
ncbi:hypothetical protein B0181_07370 [Moraxella caviae]|uniref:Uncharacterized protein conserved in bacteria n=1 Tax=Moraxella caviae TaxID=34060 RepID=A0A1T0A103_9GAMM|nr:DUF2147 domain-containing protein [Moraxella caviae]OOR89269.1 hypothetical protein B0181_07370 [Moraxella caviae]STZ13855.1 Uncharacterized protein conserved in bacteria [Moraxella caviae]VEW12048.1 Uncharacterized protein conserved in bacteria [Moraxella caviae]